MGATAGQAADAACQASCRCERVACFRYFCTFKYTHAQINQADGVFFFVNFYHRPADGCDADIETEDVVDWIGFECSHQFLHNMMFGKHKYILGKYYHANEMLDWVPIWN